MGYEQMMAVTVPLIASAEAAAALAARMRLDELGEDGDPTVRAALDRVVSALSVPGLFDDLDETARHSIIGTVTAFFKQALESASRTRDDPAGGSTRIPWCCRPRGRAPAAFPR